MMNYPRDILSISIVNNAEKITFDDIKIKFDHIFPIGIEIYDGTKDNFIIACGNCSGYIHKYGMVFIFLNI